MQIERHEIRMFHAVLEAGGFSRAAERLHVSQSAVSQAVSNLEHKVGTGLLLRTSPPQLTEAGIRMLRYAETVINEEALTLEDIGRIRSGSLSTLSLAMSGTVNRYFGQELMLEFCEENPLTRLKLDVAPSRELVYGVAEDRWEIGFGPFQRRMPGHLKCHSFFHEQRVLVVSATHPDINAVRDDAIGALAQMPLLTSWLDNPEMRKGDGLIREAFASIWEVSHLDLRLALIEKGKGATFITERLLDDPEWIGRLERVQNVPFASIEREAGVYYKRDRPLSAGAARFLSICRRRWSGS